MARPLPPFDAEFALVAACALLDDDALERAAAALLDRPGFDWERTVELAFYHEVEQVVRMRLGAAVPGERAARIQQALVSKAALQAAQTSISVRLTQALAASGIPSVLIKGVGLAHMLYAPHPELRTSNDVDIVVAPEDLGTADGVLREAGLTRSWPADEPPVAARPMFMQLANVFDYRGPVFNELVELHCRPTLNPHWLPASFADLRAAASEIDTPQGPVTALDGPLNAYYLCQHAIYNLIDFRLKWFADIARAVRRADARSAAEYIAQYPRPLPKRPALLADEVLHALTEGIERAVAPAHEVVRAGADAARIVRRMIRAEGIPVGRSLSQLPSPRCAALAQRHRQRQSRPLTCTGPHRTRPAEVAVGETGARHSHGMAARTRRVARRRGRGVGAGARQPGLPAHPARRAAPARARRRAGRGQGAERPPASPARPGRPCGADHGPEGAVAFGLRGASPRREALARARRNRFAPLHRRAQRRAGLPCSRLAQGRRTDRHRR